MKSNVFGLPIQVQQPPPLVDDPSVAEVFTDNLAGVTVNQGNINLTFATIRADHTKSPPGHQRKITSRLVMPISVAAVLHQMLGQVITELETKGLIQRATPVMPAHPEGPAN